MSRVEAVQCDWCCAIEKIGAAALWSVEPFVVGSDTRIEHLCARCFPDFPHTARRTETDAK